MQGIAVLAVGALIIAAILHYGYRLLLPKPVSGVPYNEKAARQIMGDVPDMLRAKERRRWMVDLPRSLGAPLAQVLRPFRRPLIIVSDYHAVCDIAMRRLGDFDRGPSHSEVIGYSAPKAHITMNTTDPAFRANRELIRDLMSPGFLSQTTAPSVYENTVALAQLWTAKQAKAGDHPFDARRDLFNYLLDATRCAAFGVDEADRALSREFECIRGQEVAMPRSGVNAPVQFPVADLGPDVDAIHNIGELLALGQRSPLPWVSHTLAMLNPRHLKAWFRRKHMMDRKTAQSLKRLATHGESARECALDQLLWREMNMARRLGKKPNFYASVIRDEMLGYLLGGYETTAASLSWGVKHITAHQDIQARLRVELRHAYGSAHEENRWPTVEEITSAKVPFLDAVIEETLRVSAVVFISARQAMRDTQILGYPIPKGAIIFLSNSGPGVTEPAIKSAETRRAGSRDWRLPTGWDEDSIGRYQPERWLKVDPISGEEVFDPQAGPSMAFSTGPRACWGKKLAYVQLRIAMTLLLWIFEFRSVEGELGNMEVRESFTNRPENMYVRLRKI